MNLQKIENDSLPGEHEVKIHNARELLGSKPLAKIMLDQETYLLKITKQNKLILTK
jgi:hemin uptake protein HemP